MTSGMDEAAYERMLQVADGFDAVGERLRAWSRTGQEILRDPDVGESAELSPKTHDAAIESIEAAALGRGGLLGRSLELDADALAVRATVLTYRWIDELQTAAYRSLGSIAGRAIGFLAPEVELGGSLVSAGMIETDALDRDGVAAYLGELAATNPELMEHVTSGGGGLLESLQLRSMLTTGMPADEELAAAAAGGLRAAGIALLRTDAGAAIRDTAAELISEPSEPGAPPVQEDAVTPSGLADLIAALESASTAVAVRPAAPGRYIAYLPGQYVGERKLRLVSAITSSYAAEAARTIAAAVEPGAHVMLVGAAAGGATAAALAASPVEEFVVDQVVTVGAPAAQAARVPETTRVLALEDRNDPVALLGGLVNAGASHRLTVVYDADAADATGRHLAGGRQADAAPHPELRAELDRMRALGYLA
ncbi:hypothetical protein P5P86_02690 [Nocardioides sp. BP30]|uniref:hypothetical protein n=1 Tax=Nocardioides sp. BP30 TaxID=3036374 RepID=UPI002468D4FC|nr:hypothetical protein [Nocardioides sp. BP30]WGL52740.1 hypothetical protein P5P86_02690 [Nocardioides sp. BP30]